MSRRKYKNLNYLHEYSGKRKNQIGKEIFRQERCLPCNHTAKICAFCSECHPMLHVASPFCFPAHNAGAHLLAEAKLEPDRRAALCSAPSFPPPSHTASGSLNRIACSARFLRSSSKIPLLSNFLKSRKPPVGWGIPITPRSGYPNRLDYCLRRVRLSHYLIVHVAPIIQPRNEVSDYSTLIPLLNRTTITRFHPSHLTAHPRDFPSGVASSWAFLFIALPVIGRPPTIL